MKVLIVVPGFPINLEDIKGGVSSALANLLRGLANAPIEVRVVSFNREIVEPLNINLSNNIEIYYIPEGRLPHIFNFIFRGSSIIKMHIKEFDPSIVHFAMSGYILLTKIFGLYNKVQMVTIHGIAFSKTKQKESFKEKLVWLTNAMVESIFCPVNIIHLSNYSIGLRSKKNDHNSVLIPNAVTSSYFELPIKSITNNRLVYVGAIDTNKNLLYLLQTMKALVEKRLFFSLSVLGGFMDNKYKTEVLTYVKNNQLESYVHFYGWVTQQKVQEVLAASDILMVASKQESLPMVIAEAMSAGKVVVASGVGGIPEMVTNGENGFVFNISAVENVLPALEQLYNNNSLVYQMQAKAKRTALDTYHCDAVAKKTIDFYQLLLQKRQYPG